MRGLCNGLLSGEPWLSALRSSVGCRSFGPRLAHVRSFSSNFDIFKKLQDPPQDGGADSKRKPSERVLRLVDEVLSLSLLEAADLCDLCQEKLAERGGGPSFAAAVAAGRSPFPHPSAMFSAALQTPFIGGMAPPTVASPFPPAAGGAAPQSASQNAPDSAKQEPKAEAASSAGELVKEVRALTALGLKEAKELVEAAPKIIKKGIPVAEADALKAKLEAAGAQVALE